MTIKMTSVFVPDPIEAHKILHRSAGFQNLMFMPEYFPAIATSPEDPGGTTLLPEPNQNPIAKLIFNV